MDSESQDFIILKCPPAEETDPEEPDRREEVEEQLRHTQEKLCIKESEVDSGICTMMLKSESYKPDMCVRRKNAQGKHFSDKYFK